jgi:hypothetical protein
MFHSFVHSFVEIIEILVSGATNVAVVFEVLFALGQAEESIVLDIF